jgi:glutaredoxin
MVKDYFKENKIEFTGKEVSTDKEALQDMLSKSGQTGVPVIDIDGRIIVGFDRSAIAEALGIKE